jgi:hypothetical protein
MKRHRRTWVTFIGLSLCAVLLVGASFAYRLQAAHAADNPAAQDGQPDQAVVETYFQVFNAGLLSGDFSALDTVYAPDATLTQSNTKNVAAISHGVSDIIAWYTQSFGLGTPGHGAQFTPDLRYPPIQSLAPHVVLTYEVGQVPGSSVAGYCMHVFTIKGGMIETDNWATYFLGPVK